MKCATLAVFICAILGVNGFPFHFYSTNMDTLSYGANGNGHGGMVLSQFYNPHMNARAPAGLGMAAIMFNPEEQNQQTSQYYLADRRRQTVPEAGVPQPNEVDYALTPEKPLEIEPTIADPLPTETAEVPVTEKATTLPELTEPKIEEKEERKETKEVKTAPEMRVTKKKQERKPESDEYEDEEEEEEYTPKMLNGAFFPMFFRWGNGRSSGGAPGLTAIANAFSTGRGAVASSHAIANGHMLPESKLH